MAGGATTKVYIVTSPWIIVIHALAEKPRSPVPMNLRSEAGTEVRSRIRKGKKEALHDPEELLHVP